MKVKIARIEANRREKCDAYTQTDTPVSTAMIETQPAPEVRDMQTNTITLQILDSRENASYAEITMRQTITRTAPTV